MNKITYTPKKTPATPFKDLENGDYWIVASASNMLNPIIFQKVEKCEAMKNNTTLVECNCVEVLTGKFMHSGENDKVIKLDADMNVSW